MSTTEILVLKGLKQVYEDLDQLWASFLSIYLHNRTSLRLDPLQKAWFKLELNPCASEIRVCCSCPGVAAVSLGQTGQ